jgi:hypothetical protein
MWLVTLVHKRHFTNVCTKVNFEVFAVIRRCAGPLTFVWQGYNFLGYVAS